MMENAETTLNDFLKAEARPYAVHEAGHAVVAWALGGEVLLVEVDSFAREGGKVDCRNQFTIIEDLAVCIAACGAEHLLGERTRRAAKAGDRKRMRELLSSLPEAGRRTALIAAYRLADEKLKVHADDVRNVANELIRRWSVDGRIVRIKGDELLALLDVRRCVDPKSPQ